MTEGRGKIIRDERGPRINHATHSKSFSSGGAKFKETRDRFTAHGGIARGKGRKGNRTRQTGGGDEDFLEVRQRRRARGGLDKERLHCSGKVDFSKCLEKILEANHPHRAEK